MASTILAVIFALTSSRYDGDAPLGFTLGFLAVGTALLGAAIFWDRRYRRKWRQFRVQGWRRVLGRFDEGEIVAVRKGRSGPVAGYQVWLGYDFEAEGEQGGLYTLPFSGDFPN